MEKLIIHCDIVVESPDGWNEDSPEEDAIKVLADIEFLSTVNNGWSFGFQVHDAEIDENCNYVYES